MSTKFCPACKRPNKSDATVCVHCEAPLEHGPGDIPTTARMGGNAIQPSKMTEADIRDLEIPKQGIALYLE
ncbi:MAG: zinc ribbon domain-containing protein, partial [Chloroflexota bacterium]